MIDATSPRQIPAEPHSDSRLSGFAQGVRTVTSEAAEKVQDLTRSFVPSRTTWAILVLGLMVGMWVQDKISQVNNIALQLAEIKGSINSVQGQMSDVGSDIADLKIDVAGFERRLEAQERWLETMDVYIDTTRDSLQNQGFRVAPYKSGRSDNP